MASRRIGGIGIGAFLMMSGGVLYVMTCCVGLTMRRPQSLFVASTLLYGSLVVFLFCAEREDDPYPRDDGSVITSSERGGETTVLGLEAANNIGSVIAVASESGYTDPNWYPRMFLGLFLTCSCFVSIAAFFSFHLIRELTVRETGVSPNTWKDGSFRTGIPRQVF